MKRLRAFDCDNAKDLRESDNKSYDKNFKKFFQRKEALAGILLNVVPEFKQLTHKEVMSRIVESEVNSYNAELFATEDVDEKQIILYDVVVKIMVSYQQRNVHLIFDLEMQRKFNPGYPLLNRMIYDLSRIMSKQKVSNANYQDLVPVQSTWICVKDVPKNLQNRAFHFEFKAFENYEPSNVDASQFNGLDLMRMDLLLLSENYYWNSSDPTVIKFLQSVFHNNMQSTEFNPYVTMNEGIQKEVEAIMKESEKYDVDMAAEFRQGSEETLERVNTLNQLLIKEGRLKDLERSVTDTEFQAELFKEFNL